MSWNKLVRNFYYLLKRLYRGFSLFFKELFKPTSFLKGEEFEVCLRKKIFHKDHFDLVMKTHDYHENSNDYVEASLYPDYLFRKIESDDLFWVEAKYRGTLFRGKLEWCKPYQFKRYKKLSTDLPVYIAIGFGGRPKNPKNIYVIPLKEIKYNALYLSNLEPFEWMGSRKNLLDGMMDKIYDYDNK